MNPDVRIRSLAEAIAVEYVGELTAGVDGEGRLIVALAEKNK